jgi:hypothetical protein
MTKKHCHAGLDPASIFRLLYRKTGQHGSRVKPGMTKNTVMPDLIRHPSSDFCPEKLDNIAPG